MTQAELRAAITAVLEGTLGRDKALALVQGSLDNTARASAIAKLTGQAAMLGAVSVMFAERAGAELLSELAAMLRGVASAIDAGEEVISALLAADSPLHPIAQAQQMLLELTGLVALADLPEVDATLSAFARLLQLSTISPVQWREGIIVPFAVWVITQSDITTVAALRRAENALFGVTP